MAQEVWVRQRIVAAVPEQLSLPFALWTRRAIQALVEQQFGLQLSDRLVGKYLKRWGYTAQRPVKKAMEQRNDLVQAWLRERYPAIAARAKAEGAVIYWADETAVKEDTNWIRGFAPAGRTPVLEASARWAKLSMISAITNRGEIAFQIVEGTINAERFIEFLERLITSAASKVFLIVDNLRVHHAKLVRAWVEPRAAQIELFYLPPYAPESNPDEYLNHDFKTALRLEPPSRDDSRALEEGSRHHGPHRLAPRACPVLLPAPGRCVCCAVNIFKGRVNKVRDVVAVIVRLNMTAGQWPTAGLGKRERELQNLSSAVAAASHP